MEKTLCKVVLEWGSDIHIRRGKWIIEKKHPLTNRTIYCGYNYTITKITANKNPPKENNSE